MKYVSIYKITNYYFIDFTIVHGLSTKYEFFVFGDNLTQFLELHYVKH